MGKIIFISILITVIILPFSALAHGDDLSEQGAYYNTMNMMNGWWGWFGWVFMVFFWVLLILSMVALIKWIIKK